MNYRGLQVSYRAYFIAGLVLIAALTYGSGLAQAAPQEITITPTSNDQVIQPGATYKGSLQVLNQGSTPYTFQIYSAPYHVDGEDYTPDFTVLPTAPNVKSWFTFSTAGGHINAGQVTTVDYSIHVPQNTPPGGYYAAVFAETHYPKSTGNITLNERVGEIFYLQAAGPVAKKGQLLSWQSNMLQKPPLTATLRLENNGGVHYPAAIQINVKDVFGHSKYSLKTTKEVLPQTIRRVAISWHKAPAIGLFKVTGSVNFLNQPHSLPTQWVLVLSQTARLCFISVLGVIIVCVAARWLYRRRSSRAEKLNHNG